jgi:hypothetical protein
MSGFLCHEGHSMPPGVLSCPECGSGIGSMDGKSLRECEDEEGWSCEEEDND